MGIDALEKLGSTSLDVEGARNEDVVEALKPKGTATAGKSSPTGIPIPGTPFKVADVVILRKGRIREEFQAILPDNSKRLTTIIVPTALRDTDAHYQASMITDTVKIDQDLLALNGGLVLYLFGPLLESNTQYDLVQLSVESDSADGGSGSVSNPESLPAFNAAPLAQFTSGNIVGGPGDPSVPLIVINRLDPLTKKFDAEMAFRVHAPLNAAGAAQSWQTFFGAVVSAVVDFGAGQEHVQYVIGPTDTLIDPASPGVPNRGYVDIPKKKLTPGFPGTWIKNICNLNGEKSVSNSTNIGFFSASVNQSIQGLTLVNLVAQSGDPNDAKHRKLYLEFQQPSPVAVAIKAATVEMKIQGDPDANYKQVVHKYPLREDDLLIPGQLYSVANGLAPVIDNALKMKPGVAYTLRLTFKSIGNAIYYAVLPSTLPTFNVGAEANPDVGNDIAAPSGLNTPGIDWTAAGRLRARGMFATTNIHTQKKKYLVIYDGTNDASTKFLDIVNRTIITGIANEASARFEFGLKSHLVLADIKKKIFKNVFGASGDFYAYWYDENDINISARSTDSNVLHVVDMNEVMSDSYDVIRQLDIATGLRSPGNVLGNGGWKFVDNATDQQQNWARWDGLTTPLPAIGNPGYRVITSTSADIAYVESTHSGWLKSGSSWILLQNIKDRYDPGESHGIYILMRAGAAVTVTARLHLYNLSRAALTGTLNLTSTTACVGTGTLAGTEFVVGDYAVASGQRRKVMTITDATHWTVDTAYAAASGAINVIIDNIENPISQSLALTTSNQIFGARIKMKDSPDLASTPGGTDYVSHQFGLEITGNTQDIFYFNFMDTRGSDIMAYAPRGSEGDVAGLHQLPPTFVAAPDILTAGIIGSLGGWKDLNSGGLIVPV